MFPLRMRAGPLCRPRPCSHCSTTVPRQQCVLSPSLPLTEIIELDSNSEEKGSEFVEVETTSVQPLVCHDTTESLKLYIKFPSPTPACILNFVSATALPIPVIPGSAYREWQPKPQRVDIGLITDTPATQTDIQDRRYRASTCMFHS